MSSEHYKERPRLDDGGMMLYNRLQKNLRSIGKWARQQDLQCYRLYDADLPEYAFAIDCYDRHIHMQEYEAPASISSDKVEHRREQAQIAVAKAMDIPQDLIVLKTRQRQRGSNQYQSLAEQSDKNSHNFVVHENRARLLINLHDYLDTGLFLDHRPIRKFIYENSKGKRFLNLFCYTGSASVHAALGGAITSLSCDLSNTYLDWARKNFALNKLGGKQHRLTRVDCIRFLETCRDKFDLIFLDPPTFSNSKKTDNVLDIQRDHLSLIKNAMGLLEKDGLLIFSTNKRKFKLDGALTEKFAVEDYSSASLDKDFLRNKHIHQVWMIRHAETA